MPLGTSRIVAEVDQSPETSSAALVPHHAAYGAPTPRFFPCPACGVLTLVGAQGERLTCALGWPHVCFHDARETSDGTDH
jgi:hypothetical protein